MYCQQELQQPYTSSHCSGWITHGFHWSAVNNFKATCSNPLLGLYKGRGEDPAKFTEVVAKVQKWIREERVIVFGKSDCWVCSSAKDVSGMAGQNFFFQFNNVFLMEVDDQRGVAFSV
jgi:hypothetical protein